MDDAGLAPTMYKESLRELDLFRLYQIRVGEDTVAVFSDLTGGCREESRTLLTGAQR